MAQFCGRSWTRRELVERVGDPLQVAGARASVLADGKADGVRAVDVTTGTGFQFTVLPGRGMDIPFASHNGRSIGFFSGTGITSPAYYEERDLEWRRTFYAGLLTTCGITNAGAPSVDQGKAFGLHGRVANAGAENVSIDQDWEGDEFVIRLKGTMRESEAMCENLTLTRRVETRLGRKGFTLVDTILNRGFSDQPLMLLYHFNYGFPLLGPNARVVGPIRQSVPRDEAAKKDNGLAECLGFADPVQGYAEKVFFHSLAADAAGKTFIALVNRNPGDGQPLGIVLRWTAADLPSLTQWKMIAKGFYVVGLEPGTMTPMGRAWLRERNELPLIKAQEEKRITFDFEVLDSAAAIDAVEKEAKTIVG